MVAQLAKPFKELKVFTATGTDINMTPQRDQDTNSGDNKENETEAEAEAETKSDYSGETATETTSNYSGEQESATKWGAPYSESSREASGYHRLESIEEGNSESRSVSDDDGARDRVSSSTGRQYYYIDEQPKSGCLNELREYRRWRYAASIATQDPHRRAAGLRNLPPHPRPARDDDADELTPPESPEEEEAEVVPDESRSGPSGGPEGTTQQR